MKNMQIRIIILIVLSTIAYFLAVPILNLIGAAFKEQWMIQEIQFLFFWRLTATGAMLGGAIWYIFPKKRPISNAVAWSIGIWTGSCLLWGGILVPFINGYQLWTWHLLLYLGITVSLIFCSQLLPKQIEVV